MKKDLKKKAPIC